MPHIISTVVLLCILGIICTSAVIYGVSGVGKESYVTTWYNTTYINHTSRINVTGSNIYMNGTLNINDLIICDNGTATILTRNSTLAISMGCTI